MEHGTPTFSIIAHRLVNSSLKTYNNVSEGGSLHINISAKTFAADGSQNIDSKSPLVVEVTISINGFEKNHKQGDEELIFELSSSVRGVFEFLGTDPIAMDDASKYINLLAPQVYLPLKQYIEDTLTRVGVRVMLPTKSDFTVAETDKN